MAYLPKKVIKKLNYKLHCYKLILHFVHDMKSTQQQKLYSVYILLGGNLGNRIQNLHKAKQFILKQCGSIEAYSSIYETAAWGLTNQPNFYNQALKLITHLEPEVLMENLLQIEAKMGRIRTQKMGPRIIDIDILLVEDFTCNTPILQVPHVALPFRKFALIPLTEIAPDLIHTTKNISIAQLLVNCTDTLDVQKI